jgi:hypothetical protein
MALQGAELRYCEGRGRELLAVRVEGGEERMRLPAAVVIALFYPKNKFAVSAQNREK